MREREAETTEKKLIKVGKIRKRTVIKLLLLLCDGRWKKGNDRKGKGEKAKKKNIDLRINKNICNQ